MKRLFQAIAGAAFCGIFNGASLSAQSAAFVYQGRLDHETAPADGLYDLRFTLWNAPSGGGEVAGPIDTNALAVTDGLFIVTLNFGAPAFSGAARWLEIGVKSNGVAGGHLALAPRQPLASTPYAVRAALAGSADTVDGLDSTAFAGTAHTHYDQTWAGSAMIGLHVQTSASGTPGTAAIRGRSGAGALVVPAAAAGVWGESENGYGVYAASGATHAIYADGSISADRLAYNAPRTHYFSIVGDSFRPRRVNDSIAFESSFGSGGAYFTAGAEILMLAPVHLPEGAVVTNLRASFLDNSALNLSVTLDQYSVGYTTIATVTSSGLSGTGDRSVNVTGAAAVIRNNSNSYMVSVFSTGGNWSGAGANLRIRNVTIAYTVGEAE
jgi:hypothetical protein